MKHTKILIPALFVFLFTSCKKQLETTPIGLVTLEQVNTTPTLNMLESSIGSGYQMLSNRLNILAEWNWEGGLVFQNDYILQDIASDDAQKKWNPDGDQPWMDDVDNYTFTASNGGPNGLWKYNYEGIKRVNIGISLLRNPQIEQITGVTTARKNQLLAEGLFLRSHYYFSLVSNYGDVPLILQPVKTYQEAFEFAVRADKARVWDSIKVDLQAAIALLPNTKFSSDTEKWRVSKGAAMALLAKAQLYTEKWQDAVTTIDQLEATNFYSMNTNYFSSFNTEFTDNEVIFAYDHKSGTDPRSGNGICAPLGWGFFAPTTDFLNAFEPNDPRKLYTVNAPAQNLNKLLGTTDGGNKGNDDASNNRIYIRYADVLLWKAEALNELGQYPQAIAYINKVRERARNSVDVSGNLPPVGTLPDRSVSVTDKAVIKGWLISERRVELGFESQRMLDLKRWGIAKQVLTAAGKNFQDKNMLYPIPQGEIDASAGTLTQNKGY